MTIDEHGASAGDGTRAAARLLEIATHNADELLSEARAEAASMVAAAQTEADRVMAAAHEDAERVHAELEQARTAQTTELDRHRMTVLGDLAERQAALEAQIARLHQLEQDHRNGMRSFLTRLLSQIEPDPPS